ncbi:hypothetical protein ONZ51_g7363 [Trametes cubensis]|uniref:Uncharacterized protein n=1 Tax=Trametes cubensis TaxID=1111947 RepID=A0AAD7XA90_9APHY|nr:hypothetical protein ONZ51_g7363 [Trametes cubensis]
MKIPYSTSPSEPLNLAARDDAPEEPLLLTLTLTVTLDPDATPSAVQTFSSASDRSRDAVPTPTSTDASTSIPMAETSPVVTQAASSSMSTSDASTVAAVASVVAVSIFVTSLVLYVLRRAHRRRAKASRARIECWNNDVEARMSPDYSLDKVPSHFSDDHPAGDLYDGSVIHISPDGPFATPYHARLPSTVSIPPAVQPIGYETIGENKVERSPV